MIQAIRYWIQQRRERLESDAYERGFGWALMCYHHLGHPKYYIEEGLQYTAEEYGRTSYIDGAMDALLLVPDEGESEQHDDRPRTVESALIKAQSRLLDGVIQMLAQVKAATIEAKLALDETPTPTAIEDLEQKAMQFGNALYGEVHIHCNMEKDEFVYWHRHPNGAMTRIDRETAERSLLALAKDPVAQ